MNKKSLVDSQSVRRSGRHRFRMAAGAAVLASGAGVAVLSVAGVPGSAVPLKTRPIASTHPATAQADADDFYTWHHFVSSQGVEGPAAPPVAPPVAPPTAPAVASSDGPSVPPPVPSPVVTASVAPARPVMRAVVTSSSSGGVWACIRSHESSGNYASNSGNGYYGAYQFSLSTWRSVGGTGSPSQASPAEQDLRAQMLQARSGWSQWPQTSRMCGA
jgi:hypothetical protein